MVAPFLFFVLDAGVIGSLHDLASSVVAKFA